MKIVNQLEKQKLKELNERKLKKVSKKKIRRVEKVMQSLFIEPHAHTYINMYLALQELQFQGKYELVIQICDVLIKTI